MKNPSVDLPIGIVGSLVVCAFLYALMCVVICLMVPYDQVPLSATAAAHHQRPTGAPPPKVKWPVQHDARCCEHEHRP